MRVFVITVVILLALLVGADFAGRALAESRAGEAIARQTGATVAPSVDIRGVSFLTQAIPGTYQDISIEQQDLTVGPFSGVDVVLELRDVQYPFSAALNGSMEELVAGRADVRASIPAAALAAHLKTAGLTLTTGPDGAGRIGTTIDVAGVMVPVSADVALSFADGILTVAASDVTAAGFTLPDPAGIAESLSLAVPLTGLPLDVTAAEVAVRGDTLVITATATDVRASDLR